MTISRHGATRDKILSAVAAAYVLGTPANSEASRSIGRKVEESLRCAEQMARDAAGDVFNEGGWFSQWAELHNMLVGAKCGGEPALAETMKRLQRLARSARALQKSWKEISAERGPAPLKDLVLLGAAFPPIVGLPRPGGPAWSPNVDEAELDRADEQCQESLAFSHRIESALSLDLGRFADGLEQLADRLDRRKTKIPPRVHAALWACAVAWFSATGQIPTYSENRGAKGGRRTRGAKRTVDTRFQLFVQALMPDGGYTVRNLKDVVDAAREELAGLAPQKPRSSPSNGAKHPRAIRANPRVPADRIGEAHDGTQGKTRSQR